MGLPKKGGAWTTCRFKGEEWGGVGGWGGGGLGKKEGGGIFEGEVDTPMNTMQVLLHLGKNCRI